MERQSEAFSVEWGWYAFLFSELNSHVYSSYPMDHLKPFQTTDRFLISASINGRVF